MGASRAQELAVTEGTTAREDTSWRRWELFVFNCGLFDDPYLDGFSREEKHRLLSAFAQTVRECEYSKSTRGYDHLVAGTCFAALDDISKAFVATGRPNPQFDGDGKRAFLLQRQLRGYKNLDPGEKHQKAIPLAVLEAMCKRVTNVHALRVFHELTMLAFFFAMRSCEYLHVTGKKRRTLPLRKRNIIFIKDHRILPHDSPLLEEADSITIFFEYQKNNERNESVTQGATGDAFSCPVKAGAAIIRRLQREGASDIDYIFCYKDEKNQRCVLTSKLALAFLRAYIKSIDHKGLGIPPQDVGLHSIRSSAAMAMYLNHVPVYTIMLLGRWLSDAFLQYIRKQVEQFSADVSRRMIQRPLYHHVPELSLDDPSSHNPLSAAANSDMGSSRTISRTVFSVWE